MDFSTIIAMADTKWHFCVGEVEQPRQKRSYSDISRDTPSSTDTWREHLLGTKPCLDEADCTNAAKEPDAKEDD